MSKLDKTIINALGKKSDKYFDTRNSILQEMVKCNDKVTIKQIPNIKINKYDKTARRKNTQSP